MKTETTAPTVEMVGATYELPPEVQALGHDNLYIVPLTLIRPADKKKQQEDGAEYQWVNPRHYEDGEDEETPQGFTEEDMESLLRDVRDDGLIYPLVCRWIVIDGQLEVEILDGERRWRSISQLFTENQQCKDNNSDSMRPAQELYKSVLCKVYIANDKKGFKLAYQATNRQVKWGERANVRAIKHLRDTGCTDKEILELTNKSGQWLREEDKLCSLDKHSFSYYSTGKVNRAVALRVADIPATPTLERRHLYLEETYKEAQEADAKRMKKLDEEIARLEDREELAEAQLAVAQELGTGVEEAQANLEEAQDKTKAKKRQKARGAQAKTKHLRQAVSRLSEEGEGGEEEEAEGGTSTEEPPESVVQALRPGKIKKQLEVLEGLEENGGMNAEGEEIVPPDSLVYVIAGFRAILNGEENIEKVMKRQQKVIKLKEARQRTHA